MRTFHLKLLLASAFVFSVGLYATPAWADQYYDAGVKLFQQQKFSEAQLMFEYRLRVSPGDTNALFCKAMCLDKQAKVGEACEILRGLRKKYPNSAIDKRAADALVGILGDTFREELKAERGEEANFDNPGKPLAHATVKAKPSELGEKAKEETVEVPKDARVHYESSREDRDDIMVEVLLNGRRLKMMFDTGAYGVLVYQHQVNSLGIRIPDTAREEWTGGIGGRIRSVVFPMTVELAGIKRTIEVHVADGDGTPLLGQGFVADLEYEVDHKGHYIHFRKARPYDSSAKTDMYCVPFRLKGRHLVVDVEFLDGRKSPMIVDTGASSNMLSARNFYDFGMNSIPNEAVPMSFTGVGDSTRFGYSFQIDQLKLGPIISKMPYISVLWSRSSGRALNALGDEGLLGQPFFGNWKYTVDMKNKVLRFFH